MPLSLLMWHLEHLIFKPPTLNQFDWGNIYLNFIELGLKNKYPFPYQIGSMWEFHLIKLLSPTKPIHLGGIITRGTQDQYIAHRVGGEEGPLRLTELLGGQIFNDVYMMISPQRYLNGLILEQITFKYQIVAGKIVFLTQQLNSSNILTMSATTILKLSLKSPKRYQLSFLVNE